MNSRKLCIVVAAALSSTFAQAFDPVINLKASRFYTNKIDDDKPLCWLNVKVTSEKGLANSGSVAQGGVPRQLNLITRRGNPRIEGEVIVSDQKCEKINAKLTIDGEGYSAESVNETIPMNGTKIMGFLQSIPEVARDLARNSYWTSFAWYQGSVVVSRSTLSRTDGGQIRAISDLESVVIPTTPMEDGSTMEIEVSADKLSPLCGVRISVPYRTEDFRGGYRSYCLPYSQELFNEIAK